MNEADIQLVRSIVLEELGPALEDKCKKIEAAMISATTEFQKQVRLEVRQDHAENRTRLQQSYDIASRALETATRGVAQGEYIIRRMDGQDTAIGKTNSKLDNMGSALYELAQEVKSALGRKQGEDEANAQNSKRAEAESTNFWTWVKWIIGIGSSGGFVALLEKLIHRK